MFTSLTKPVLESQNNNVISFNMQYRYWYLCFINLRRLYNDKSMTKIYAY